MQLFFRLLPFFIPAGRERDAWGCMSVDRPKLSPTEALRRHEHSQSQPAKVLSVSRANGVLSGAGMRKLGHPYIGKALVAFAGLKGLVLRG